MPKRLAHGPKRSRAVDGEGVLNDNNTIRAFSGQFRLNPPARRVSFTPSTDSRADRDKCEIIFQISGGFRNARTSPSSVQLRFSDTVCACSTVVWRVISRAENARAAATAASLRWTREVQLRKNRRASTNGRVGRGLVRFGDGGGRGNPPATVYNVYY